MNGFRLFLENLDPAAIVHFAQQARQEAGITDARTPSGHKHCGAVFGDCKDVGRRTVQLLQTAGIPARLDGGVFQCSGDDQYDHSWVVIDNNILDPTIDQFFSELDEDMTTEVPGIYYSHPEWDGNKYVERYHK